MSLVALFSALAGCAGRPGRAAWFAVCMASAVGCLWAAPPQAIAVAAGVYLFQGGLDEVGEVGNTGLIVGDTASVMINSGASYAHGKALLEAAERVGGRPVALLVITQPLPEFTMGAAAFAERGIPMLAHKATAQLIAERCARCLERLSEQRGAETMRGTAMVVPERLLERSRQVVVGGRSIDVLFLGWGGSPGDLVVRDAASGVVFAGALASFGRLPDLRDASLPGWLDALGSLQALATSRVVPGYGPAGGREQLSQLRRYLVQTDQIVRQQFEAQASLSQVLAESALPGFSSWALYEPLHLRNVQHRYIEMEKQWLMDARKPP